MDTALTPATLDGMDADELREHAAAYYAANLTADHVARVADNYVAAIARRIARMTGIAWYEVFADIEMDAQAIYERGAR